MTISFQDIAAQAAQDGIITDAELLDLRRSGWCDGTISPPEAEAIFAINRSLGQRSAAWTDFFVEALGEYLLGRQEPRGYMAEEQADWLIARVTHDGQVDSMAELELLTRVIERASNVPDKLKTFVLEQLEAAVLTGTGPTRFGGALSDTHVSEAEVALLRRVRQQETRRNALRRWKRGQFLRIIARDFVLQRPQRVITREVSLVADACCRAALASAAAEVLGGPVEEPPGLAIIAMGKWGSAA